MVAPSPELLPALADLPKCYHLVPVEDVLESSAVRSDIVAALLGRGAPGLPVELLAKLPNLGVVGIMGLSLARYSPEALLERDVTLVNASAAYAEAVADFALGLAILGRRRAFLSHELMRSGGWGAAPRVRGFERTFVQGVFVRGARMLRPVVKRMGLEAGLLRLWKTRPRAEARPMPPRDLCGATAGLIGWGANGRAFAERLVRAGAYVQVYSEHAAPEEIFRCGATPVSLAEALAADIVSLHRGLTPATKHCLGAAELAKLRPGAVLINVARGALIEPGALYARLRLGDIFACLDTYDQEPLSSSHPLRRLPNVFLTAHIAGGSSDMQAAAAREVVNKVTAYLAGAQPECVTAERLGSMT